MLLGPAVILDFRWIHCAQAQAQPAREAIKKGHCRLLEMPTPASIGGNSDRSGLPKHKITELD